MGSEKGLGVPLRVLALHSTTMFTLLMTWELAIQLIVIGS
jgi:hypothetical protein